MKNLILIVCSILFFSCAPQKKVLSGGGTSSLSKPSNLGMKMYGKVVVKSNVSSGENTEIPVLYFDNGVSYLINFSESKVSKAEIQQYVYKDIDIVGEIKKGKIPSQNQQPQREEAFIKEGSYIVIYKIL